MCKRTVCSAALASGFASVVDFLRSPPRLQPLRSHASVVVGAAARRHLSRLELQRRVKEPVGHVVAVCERHHLCKRVGVSAAGGGSPRGSSPPRLLDLTVGQLAREPLRLPRQGFLSTQTQQQRRLLARIAASDEPVAVRNGRRRIIAGGALRASGGGQGGRIVRAGLGRDAAELFVEAAHMDGAVATSGDQASFSG